ncbi:hypothetical protein EV127DRAFT_486063 [Xylaria flabelliformis]|nr:hypothetical protein EV127DRAFT_486063 [Xylaria flabelliformis]
MFVHFVHDEQCDSCCDTYDAINIGTLSKAVDDEANIFSDIIQAAVKEHAESLHWLCGPAYVSTCYFVWKDKGRGRDVMSMKEAAFSAQVALARGRGWIDSIHVEFWIDSSAVDSSGTEERGGKDEKEEGKKRNKKKNKKKRKKNEEDEEDDRKNKRKKEDEEYVKVT